MSHRHSFAIMAYKDAPFLDEAVASVLSGARDSDVYVTTSTPSERISAIAAKNGLPLHVNTGKAGIVGDWQFALAQAKTPFVTLVDQDDRYDPQFAELVLKAFDRYPDSQIVFTNYVEIDASGAVRPANRTLRVKRVLLAPFAVKMSLASRFGRRLILRFGNPICSPSVTYNLPQLGTHELFDEQYAMSLDWEAWLSMAERSGRFTYIRRPLEQHRIHGATQTSTGLRDGRRYAEDVKLYGRLWPARVARFLADRYAASYKNERVSAAGRLRQLRDFGPARIAAMGLGFVRTQVAYRPATFIFFPIDLRGRRHIRLGRRMTCGRGCRFKAYPPSGEGVVLRIGDDVQINDYVHITASESVVLEDRVLLASRIYISDTSHGDYSSDAPGAQSDPESTAKDRPLATKPVLIRENAWLGEGVCVLPGVTIGRNAIVGAGSVVTKDVPDDTIVAGNPARPVRAWDPATRRWERA